MHFFFQSDRARMTSDFAFPQKRNRASTRETRVYRAISRILRPARIRRCLNTDVVSTAGRLKASPRSSLRPFSSPRRTSLGESCATQLVLARRATAATAVLNCQADPVGLSFLQGTSLQVTSARSRQGKIWLSGTLHRRRYCPLILSYSCTAISSQLPLGQSVVPKMKLRR